MSEYGNRLLRALGFREDRSAFDAASRATGVATDRLKYYNRYNKVPLGSDLNRILAATGLTETALCLRMGRLSYRTIDEMAGEAHFVKPAHANGSGSLKPALTTRYGKLYKADCLDVLPKIEDESVDVVFADPPFNLRKLYPSGIDDDLREHHYLRWCEEWIQQLIRVLKWGGSFFLWNLPRWNSVLAGIIDQHLTFRHWIAVDIKYTLPIQRRLYPSHYSLLYYCKGEAPEIFHPDRLPMEICPSCLADLRDYGGYKSKMNPKGVNLADVWYDISPVRHSRYKKRDGANELSVQLMDRIIEMSSDEGSTILDPFGGSGTTYAVAEMKRRRWIGIEIGPVDTIKARLADLDEERQHLAAIRKQLNCLFREEHRSRREQIGLWTPESVRAER